MIPSRPASDHPARRLLAALVALVALVAPARGRAGDPGDTVATAQALFEEGRALFKAGDFQAACERFAASHALDPASGTAGSLGRCYEQLGRTASAWAAYAEAESLARRTGNARYAAQARARLDALEPHLSRLTIVVAADAPAGLQLRRDGRALPAETAGLAAPVDPGRHVVAASAPGYRTWSQELDVPAGGAEVVVHVPALAPERAPVVPVAEAAGAAPRRTGGTRRLMRVGAAALAATAVVGAAAGGYYGLSARQAWQDAQPYCQPSFCDSQGLAYVDEAGRAADRSTALFVIAGVAAGTAVALWWLTPGEERVQVGAVAGREGAALLVRGSF